MNALQSAIMRTMKRAWRIYQIHARHDGGYGFEQREITVHARTQRGAWEAAKSPRWTTISATRIAATILAAIIAATVASAANAAPISRAANTIRHVAGSYPYALDCTYAPKQAVEEGEAFPPYHGSSARVYVRPWVCAQSGRAVRGVWDVSSGTEAMALLVLLHESIHVSAFQGATSERATECRAVLLFPLLLAALRAPVALVPGLVGWAAAAHGALLLREPSVYGPGC